MKKKHVKLEYDAEADAAYLTLGAGKVIDSEEVRPGLILDFGANDQVLGVEILRFSRRFRSRKIPPRPTARGRTTRAPAA
jgi:uncharacterized protein YuzE